MRKRDLGVLLLAVFAVFYSVQHQGGARFQDAWYIVGDDVGPLQHEGERLPPPIITDLNGDGRSEIIVATHDAKIQIYKPRRAGHDDDSFTPARLLAEVSLLPERVRVQKGRRPVAMATGYLQKKVPKLPRKQVLVVVTGGWHIFCYDSNLKFLWDQNVQEHFPHGAYIKEVAITISNYSMRSGDLGSVIIGGSMEAIPQEKIEFARADKEEEDVEKLEEAHAQAASEKAELEDVTDHGIGELGRHFSYYAFDGLTGNLRWHHNGSMNLPSGGLHADVNHDGVIDHVQVSGGDGSDLVFPTGMEKPMQPCWAIATTGFPVREQLFNGSVCSDRRFASRFGYTEGSTLSVATPILLPKYNAKKHRTVGGGVVFFNSRGDVTAYDVENTHAQHNRHASKLWQVTTHATWHVWSGDEDSRDDFTPRTFLQPKPTLHAMSSRVGGPADLIVAAGESSAVILSLLGSKITEMYFPSMPTEQLECADFNNDGLMDIILVSGQSYYGYQQRRRPGMSLFSGALGVLILIVIVALIVQHISEPKQKPRPSARSNF